MSDTPVTRIERQANCIVAHVLAASLDEEQLALLQAEISAAGAQAPALPMFVDMTQVGFMPSLSLGGLVQLLREFKARGQRLVLTGLQPVVRQTMSLTRIDRLFEIHDSL